MAIALSPIRWRVRTMIALFSLLLLVVFSISAILVFSSEQEVIWIQTTRIGTDKQLLARAGAQRIQTFFQRVETDLRILSQAGVLGDFERTTTRQLMQVAVDRYEGTPLVSFVRVTRDGEVAISVNRQRLPVAEGMMISDREYFQWARRQTDSDGVYLSSPLVARTGPLEGQLAVAISVPVFKDGSFDGLVFASIGMEKLIQTRVADLSVYQGPSPILLDQDGTILTGVFAADDIGANARDIISSKYPKAQQAYEHYLDEILLGVNSWIEVEVDLRGEGRQEKWIIGFAPVEFGDRMWSLLTLVSHEEALGRIERYQARAQAGLLFAGLGVVGIGALYILSLRKVQVVWYKRGFAKAREAVGRARTAIGIDGEEKKDA